MTCTDWPDCSKSPQCARCAVLDRCLAQVPFYTTPDMPQWFRRTGYDNGEVMGGGSWLRQGTLEKGREMVTREVADRLITWLAWPGICLGCGNDLRETHAPGRCFAEQDAPTMHPLDGTPAGELRGLASKRCDRCNGHGERATWIQVAADGYRHDEILPVPNTIGHHELLSCPPTTPDWPTVLAICDVLDLPRPQAEHLHAHDVVVESADLVAALDLARQQGEPVDAWLAAPTLWAEVHAWRPPNEVTTDDPERFVYELSRSMDRLGHDHSSPNWRYTCLECQRIDRLPSMTHLPNRP